jgi:hypothetical protein
LEVLLRWTDRILDDHYRVLGDGGVALSQMELLVKDRLSNAKETDLYSQAIDESKLVAQRGIDVAITNSSTPRACLGCDRARWFARDPPATTADYFGFGGDPAGWRDDVVEPALTKSRICPRRAEYRSGCEL